MERYKKILKRKHLLIIGKTELERNKFITKLIQIAGYQTFRFPKNIKTFGDYYNSMKKMKLYEPWYEAKSYNGNAIWDFHRDWISNNNYSLVFERPYAINMNRDWISNNNYSLVVLEEIQYMEERWKHEIIRLFIQEIECKKKGEDTIHLIISQESEDDLIEKMRNVIYLRENERRTRRQIIE